MLLPLKISSQGAKTAVVDLSVAQVARALGASGLEDASYVCFLEPPR